MEKFCLIIPIMVLLTAHCIMFNKDLSDFHDKLLFSISDSIERTKIISNAYDDFMENHTWYHRVSKILTIMEDYHG